MIYNQLLVIPTESTLEIISAALTGAPMEIDLPQLNVELTTTLDAVTANPANFFYARPTSVKLWYDAYLQRSIMILSLESSQLQQRALELINQGVIREGCNYYNPHMVLSTEVPGQNRRMRRFVRQASEALCSLDQSLEFTMEHVVQVDLRAPLNLEYNKAMFEERMNRRDSDG